MCDFLLGSRDLLGWDASIRSSDPWKQSHEHQHPVLEKVWREGKGTEVSWKLEVRRLGTRADCCVSGALSPGGCCTYLLDDLSGPQVHGGSGHRKERMSPDS